MKPRLGIDVDDILLDFNTAIHPFYNAKAGTSFSRKDAHSFNFENVWKCSYEDAVKTVFDFYESPLHLELKPVPGSQEAMFELSKRYDLIIMTSRPDVAKEGTMALLDRYFPNLFSDHIFTGEYGSTEKKRSKGEIAKERDMIGFVDDALHNAQSLSEYGIPVYMLSTPWNQGELPNGAQRFNSWEEIVKAL